MACPTHPSSSQVCLQQVLGTLFQLKGSQANNFTVEQILLYVQVHYNMHNTKSTVSTTFKCPVQWL